MKIISKISRLYVLLYIVATCLDYNMTFHPTVGQKILTFLLIFAWAIYINSDLKE